MEHTANYHDPATGLAVRSVATEYADFPAVEWVVHFGNAGVADTPILSDILPLDVLFPLDAAAPCQVHHARGGLTQPDDFEPLKTPLTFRQGGSKLELSARTGKSSTLHLPFFNLEMGGGGVIGAIGWSGGWKAGFQRQRDGITCGQAWSAPIWSCTRAKKFGRRESCCCSGKAIGRERTTCGGA